MKNQFEVVPCARIDLEGTMEFVSAFLQFRIDNPEIQGPRGGACGPKMGTKKHFCVSYVYKEHMDACVAWLDENYEKLDLEKRS